MGAVFPSRADIASLQLQRLRELLAAILPTNRFYSRKFSKINPSIKDLDDFSERFPFTIKKELVEDQLARPLFGTNLTFPLERYTRFHQTSGTTGTPLRWLDTPESWRWMLESWKEVFRAAKIGAGERVYFAFSFGPFIGFWLAFEAAQQLGLLCFPGGGLSSESRLHAILENEISVLCCTPTYALRLAEVAGKNGLKKSKVKKILVAGEPGGSIPATRARLEKLWPGAKIFDHHGMTEVGPVTFECPKYPGVLHVIESAYFAEIIDPQTGAKTFVGETGEMVLTTLGRTGSPLMRYRTGDLVRERSNANLKTVCACGRSEMALEGGILGRVDNMMIIRGVNVYPVAVEVVLRGFPEISEYQIQVITKKSLIELKVRVELKDHLEKDKIARRIEQSLRLAFNLRIPVKIVSPGALPRFEMKANRWIRR